MIVTQGGRFGGYGFYALKGKPVFLYNFVDVQRTRWGAAPEKPVKVPQLDNARMKIGLSQPACP
jgi:hypothetical protein